MTANPTPAPVAVTPEPRDPAGLGPFLFAVGVVGHRDLVVGDTADIRADVARFLAELASRVPHATIQVVTGLAAGADLVVAEVARELGVSVVAVLPMPWEMYRRDFSGEERQRAERMLAADGVEVAELPPPDDVDMAAAQSDGAERDRLYVGLMDHLVARSHLLLALWDGEVTGLPGGTGDVVLAYLGGRDLDLPPGPVDLGDQADAAEGADAVVAWVPVRRSSGLPRADRSIRFLVVGVRPSAPVVSGEFPAVLEARLEALDDHLRDAAQISGAEEPGGGSGLLSILDGDADQLAHALRPIADEFERADRSAVIHQRRSNLVFKAMALIAGAMGLVFLMYAKIDALEVYLAIYLGLSLAGYLLYSLARRCDWFTRHLTDRVVAESLRVRFYLALCGVPDGLHAERLLDLLGISRLRGFAWVRDAWRVGALPSGAALVDPSAVDRVRRSWIDDQAEYFRARLADLLRRQERLERVRSALFGLAFVAGVVLLFFAEDLGEVEITGTLDLKTAVLVLMGLLPLWLGIWELYQNKMATRELIWQYRNQAEHFTAASRALARPLSPDEQRRVLVDLGDRALFEVYLWSLHRFHREYEPSLPG